MQVIVQDLAVNYVRAGTASRVIVYVHGWADSAATFGQLVQDLSDDYTVVAMDLPGFGGSQSPTVAWGVPEYASFVVAMVKKLGISKVYGIVGHSNGGTVALYIAAHQLMPVERLLLLGTAGIRTTTAQNRHRQAWKLVAKTGKAATVLLPGAVRQKLRAKLYAAADSDLLVAPHMQQTFKMVVGYDVRADAASIRIPVRFIHGTQDTAVPLPDARLLATTIAGSEFITLPAGHFVHHEQPSEVARLAKEFLA